jgi:hypothetical protein
MIPNSKTYCCREHCNENRRKTVEQKLETKRKYRKTYEERNPERTKRIKASHAKYNKRRGGSKVINNKIERPRPADITVFGDRDPGVIWRPAALGGPIPKTKVEAS